MYRRLTWVIVFLTAVSTAAGQSNGYPKRWSLNGTWDYAPLARTTLKPGGAIAEDKSNLPAPGRMAVPSNWHLSGLPNFNGRVRFERDFDFAEKLGTGDRVFLIFHGVDYFTEVVLNEMPVGSHEGYFQAFEYDVTPFLKRGRNHLAVTVDAPLEEPGTVWPDHKRMIKGVFSHWDCKPGNVYKATGQDGTSAGIWNDVDLELRRVGPNLTRRVRRNRSGVPGAGAPSCHPGAGESNEPPSTGSSSW